MKQFVLTRPAPGKWTMRTQGRGLFMANVESGSTGKGEPKVQPIQLEFDFLANDASMDRVWDLKPGEKRRVKLTVEGAVQSANLQFVTQRGLLLATFPLQVATATNKDDRWQSVERTVQVAVPRQSFRARIVGKDSNGTPYQRTEANYYRFPIDPQGPAEPPMSNEDMLKSSPKELRSDFLESLTRTEKLTLAKKVAAGSDSELAGLVAASLTKMKADDEVLGRFAEIILGGHIKQGFNLRHADPSDMRWAVTAMRYLLDRYDGYSMAQKGHVGRLFPKIEGDFKEQAGALLDQWEKGLDQLDDE